MPTLGEELRRSREERGVSLADISEATRIGTRFLKAIESDNFSVLPGGIFTRSFIRAFAKQVGMNEDKAIALYHEQVTGQSVEVQPQSPQPPPQETKARPSAPVEVRPRRAEPVIFRETPTRTNWTTIIIAAGILLFIVITIFALVKKLNRSDKEVAQQTTNPPAAQKVEPPATAPPATGAQPEQPQSTQPAPAQPPAQTQSAPPMSVASGEPLVVKIEAVSGDSWIRYQADDTPASQTILKQGQAQDVPPAQNQIKLNLGNRLAVKVTVNNREITFPADTPKFKAQVVISRENLQAYFQ